eukprot:TRINITY_DN47672_c0_g1_i2.p1 TRINITY_DN47672_c0_g1~~TRINITY_DN47672_c0_g1_i2.p1  ORF type:complete len:638 (+),score=107.97 TRINITY_DN47672_c0_g1_i2:102-2015(+)
MARIEFTEELPDDVLYRVLLRSSWEDSLQVSAGSRSCREFVQTIGHRLFATFFRSSVLPGCLLASRPRLLRRVDCARSAEKKHVHETFSWAASFGYTGQLQAVAAVWAASGQLQKLLEHRARDGDTALCCAARKQQREAVNFLLESRANVDAPGKSGCTALYLAARNGDVGIVQRLVEHGASGAKPCRKDECPLSAIIRCKDTKSGPGGRSSGNSATPERLECLRLMAASLDAEQRGSPAVSRAFLVACALGQRSYVDVLLASSIVSGPPLVTDASAATPGTGSAASAPTGGGSTSTQPARSSPAGQAAGATASRGVSPAAVGGPLEVTASPPPTASRRQRPQSAQSGRGRADRAQRPTPQPAAAAASSAQLPAETTLQGTTALLVAASQSFYDVLELLLNRDSASAEFIDATLPSGKSALYLAAEKGDARACSKLLAAGASLDVLTCSGRSALFAAVESASVETVETLCSNARARHLLLQTPAGVTPVSLAERRGTPPLILPFLRCYERLLKQRSSKRGNDDDPTDWYIASLCVKFKDLLAAPVADATTTEQGESKRSSLSRQRSQKLPDRRRTQSVAAEQRTEGGTDAPPHERAIGPEKIDRRPWGAAPMGRTWPQRWVCDCLRSFLGMVDTTRR